LPQGEGFPAAVQDLLWQLPELLGVDGTLLDLSESSLDHVDVAIRRMGQQGVLTREVLPALTAYVGEVLRRAVDGQWRMREGPAGWQPWIVTADNRAHAILGIAKDIQEHGRTVSLRGFVIAKIHARGSRL
jgi:hypothetical protein